MDHTIFVIEDTLSMQRLYKHLLEEGDFTVRLFERAESALDALEVFEPSTICLDIGLPGMSGMEALERIRRRRPQVPVIMLTAEDAARTGVQAMKLGAADYLVKPVEGEELVQAVTAAVERFELVLEIRQLRAQLTGNHRANEIIGQSPAINLVTNQIGLLVNNDVTVFLRGENGTGKELIARAIHRYSRRADRPFVAVNCGAIPRELQESAFFGHEKGSFTGALNRHLGFFEEAHGGTILLDEVGELTPEAQVKLLRVLQEREIRRVGGDRALPIDVRVISASNRDLKAMLADGSFRDDLYYRLVVFPITIAPLRERRTDIPLLTGHFLRLYCEQLGVAIPELTDESLACFVHHQWPGNVRELQNAVQFAIVASQGEPIEPHHLPEDLPRVKPDEILQGDRESLELIDPLTGQVKSFNRLELEIFLRARDLAGDSVTRAAEMLGVGRATIYRRLQNVAHGRAPRASAPPADRPADP